MSKQHVEMIAFEMIKKKQERFLEEVKDILNAVETHRIYNLKGIPAYSFAYHQLILDDIRFVGKTISELQYYLRVYGLLAHRNVGKHKLEAAYHDAYDVYNSNFRFNPNDIDTYVKQLPHETSSAFDKAKQEVEGS